MMCQLESLRREVLSVCPGLRKYILYAPLTPLDDQKQTLLGVKIPMRHRLLSIGDNVPNIGKNG